MKVFLSQASTRWVPCFFSKMLRWLWAMALLWVWGCGAALAANAGSACSVKLLGSWSAKEVSADQRPPEGNDWQAVKIPHVSSQQWPGWGGPVWYRLDWQLNCPKDLAPGDAQLALAVSGIRVAGTVYWNHMLLWSDRSLVEPYSRSWNMPRWWPVAVSDTQAVQTAWVRVVTTQAEVMGLGYVELGDMRAIQDTYAERYWRQRTSYVQASGLSLTIACVALVVWLWRRSEKIYLWMGLMQLCWTLYLTSILSLAPGFGLGSNAWSVLHLLFFMLYGNCFLVFVLRFYGQKKPYLEYALWAVLGLWTAYIAWDAPPNHWVGVVSLVGASVVFNCSCLYAIYRALRTRAPKHLLLGAACAVMLVVAVHDTEVALRRWDNDQTWAYFGWQLNLLILAVLLGWQVASHMRRVDRFNVELTEHVAQARAELAQVLAQQHAKDLQNAKLHERMQLAHDLHDGLGGSLVRSMALVEQAPQQLSNDRVMSLLKTLRDDLRQVIDSGSSSGVTVPASPLQWLAPLRRRFSQVLEELEMQSHWQIDAQWKTSPSIMQCMGLARFLEEAFTNVIKHSRATEVVVVCTMPDEHHLQLSVQDNGIGFDVAAAQATVVGVGMRSMQTRVQRIGGTLQVSSRPGASLLQASVVVSAE